MMARINIKQCTKALITLHCSLFIGVVLTSCADSDMEQLSMEKPATLASYEYLQQYDVLKTYADHIGVTMDEQDFLSNGMKYRIAVGNFSELVPGAAFSHARMVKANGTIDSVNIAKVLQRAEKCGMTLIGTPLIWHRRQNATYLNSLLLPNVVRPEGDDGGYCIKMTNTAAIGGPTAAQVAYTFAKTPQVEPGITYKLKMMVKGTTEGTLQVATYSNGKGSRFTPDISITKEWTKVEMLNTMASGIKGLTSLLFNLGQYVGTVYVDNIELVEWNTSRQREIGKNLNTQNTNLDDPEQTTASIAVHNDENGSLEDVGCSALGEGYDPLATYTEKTAEEKRTILTAEMQRYLGRVISSCKSVSDWVVVSEPLATAADADISSFYWQQYLGATEYAVQAFKEAARHTDGKLYVGEKDLESSTDKCQQLMSYIRAVEDSGARIDGIAIAIAANTTATRVEAIGQLFDTLVASGKLIRISDLSVAIGNDITTDEATEEQLQQQAELTERIVEAYVTKVPAAQRGGITLHQVLDDSQPLGLWTAGYERKHCYGAIARQLKQ